MLVLGCTGKDCRDAYKNWLCAALFRRCHVPNEAVLEAAEEEGTEIPVEQQGAICQNGMVVSWCRLCLFLFTLVQNAAVLMLCDQTYLWTDARE